MSDGIVIRIDLLERDSRFTRFAPGALDHEIESVLSIPLVTRDRVVGALNMYSHLPNALDASTEEAAQPMADVAAEAIGTSPLYAFTLDMVEGLVETLESQALMNQAVGDIVADENRTIEEALDRLRQLAMASGKPMRASAVGARGAADHSAAGWRHQLSSRDAGHAAQGIPAAPSCSGRIRVVGLYPYVPICNVERRPAPAGQQLGLHRLWPGVLSCR